MSPTIFDASQNEEQARREELERELEAQKQLARSKSSNSLPAREEQQEEVSQEEQQQKAQQEEKPPEEKTDSPEENDDMSTEPQASLEPQSSSDSSEPQAAPEGTSENPIHVQVENVQEISEASEKEKEKRNPEEYSELIRIEEPTSNPFAAISIRPQNTYFDSQHAKEEILMVLRQHPIVNLGWVALSVVLVLLPFTLFPLLPLFSLIPDRFQFFALIGWYLLVLAYMIENFLYWYFNIYIITDERIVDVDFYSLIYRALSSAKIENIQDTTATTKGVLGAIFNFGDVSIQTAAEKREFEFLSVPQPATVTKFLNELILEEEREKLEGRIM